MRMYGFQRWGGEKKICSSFQQNVKSAFVCFCRLSINPWSCPRCWSCRCISNDGIFSAQLPPVCFYLFPPSCTVYGWKLNSTWQYCSLIGNSLWRKKKCHFYEKFAEITSCKVFQRNKRIRKKNKNKMNMNSGKSLTVLSKLIKLHGFLTKWWLYRIELFGLQFWIIRCFYEVQS